VLDLSIYCAGRADRLRDPDKAVPSSHDRRPHSLMRISGPRRCGRCKDRADQLMKRLSVIDFGSLGCVDAVDGTSDEL